MKFETAIQDYLKGMTDLLSSPDYAFSSEPPESLRNDRGVYAILETKSGQVIYVGRSGMLRSRLLGDHRSGDVIGSQFRRALKERRGLTTEPEISEFIAKNCSFRFLKVSDLEEEIRLEHFATAIVGPELNVKLKR